jgi:hypothetical protein
MEKLNQLQTELLSAAADISIIKCCDTEFTKDLRLKHITLLSLSIKQVIELSAEISNLKIEVIETKKNNY